MAKGKKRGNWEIRKPKANRLVANATTSPSSTKGLLGPKSVPKKKS